MSGGIGVAATSPWFNRVIFLLSTIGLLVAGYLWFLHASHQSVPCGASSGCETVAASPYAKFPPGKGPWVAAYGTVGYAGILLLALLRTLNVSPSRDRLLLGLILLGAAIGTAFSGWLTYIEIAVLHAICRWCVASQVIILLVFLVSATEWGALLRRRNTSVPPAPAAEGAAELL